MTNKTIPNLTAATTPLTGAELVPINQTGTEKVSVANLTAGRPVSMSQMDAGNIRATGNTISSTDTNGNINIDPDGTGQVNIPATLELNKGVVGVLQISGTSYRIEGGATYGDIRAFAPRHRWYSNTGTYWGQVTASGIALPAGANFIPASGNGIDFSAASHAAGMTSELLDDYEEGTFTPSLTFGGGSTGMVYSYQEGKYTKVGNRVTINIHIRLTSKGTSTGNASISGLPFAIGGVGTLDFDTWWTNMSTSLQPFTNGSSGSTTIYPQLNVSGSSQNSSNTAFTDTSRLSISGTYEA